MINLINFMIFEKGINIIKRLSFIKVNKLHQIDDFHQGDRFHYLITWISSRWQTSPVWWVSTRWNKLIEMMNLCDEINQFYEFHHYIQLWVSSSLWIKSTGWIARRFIQLNAFIFHLSSCPLPVGKFINADPLLICVDFLWVCNFKIWDCSCFSQIQCKIMTSR